MNQEEEKSPEAKKDVDIEGFFIADSEN